MLHFPFLLLIPVSGCVPMTVTGISASTGTLMLEDRRSSGVFIEDEQIRLVTARRIQEKFGDNVHINVTSFNHNVLLTGEALTETTRNEIFKLAANVKNVRNIFNEVIIAPQSSLTARSNDVLITSKIKSVFLNNDSFQTNHVKVVTERNVVYLAGIVKRAEGEKAAELASGTPDVIKVIKVFEYLD
ncbi:MAG: BON domain-containing protein [Nitrosomonas sp.]|nr:BON domain-containing protein [Nitrosomonas sp.]